jgi:hypothetical protein
VFNTREQCAKLRELIARATARSGTLEEAETETIMLVALGVGHARQVLQELGRPATDPGVMPVIEEIDRTLLFLGRFHSIQRDRKNAGSPETSVQSRSDVPRADPKKRTRPAPKAEPYEQGHFHYRSCANDSEERHRLSDCGCQARSDAHFAGLVAMAQKSKGRQPAWAGR